MVKLERFGKESFAETENKIAEIKKRQEFEVENTDCFIHIRYSTNDFEHKKTNPKMRQKLGEAGSLIKTIRNVGYIIE